MTHDTQHHAHNHLPERTGIPMMMNTTIEQLRGLRLTGMATGLRNSSPRPDDWDQLWSALHW
jgi:hypothetical protein